MKISGQNTIAAPVEKVWEAILDPRVLVATIPGCEQLEATGENAYAMTVSAGVAAIKGTYSGSCVLEDLRAGDGLTMKLKGAGAPGTIDADYRGEVKVLLVNLGSEPFTVRRGERIAQLVVARVEHVRVEAVTDLGGTARGPGGFGSTG